MSDDTDFVSMYEELGLDAECGMHAFKQAYRRRVAALHPDIQGTASDLPRLQRLNRLYEATLDFHRLHGRLPGASAPLAALVGSGMPSDAFLFAGFLPVKDRGKRDRFAELAKIPATLIFFESPRRIGTSLKVASEVLGRDRRAVFAAS